MDWVVRVLMVLVGYVMGSIPTGLLVVRVMTGKDVRQVGSGKTGGTNVLRAAGAWGTTVTVLVDTAKGLLAVLLARAVTANAAVEALAGLAAVVGHNYSAFIGFRGGAGTMTTIGGATGLWPWSGPALLVVGVPVLLLTRYASVASIVVGLALPAIYALRAWLVHAPWAYLIHGLGTAALTLWALRTNIRRLLTGQERKLGSHKQAENASAP